MSGAGGIGSDLWRMPVIETVSVARGSAFIINQGQRRLIVGIGLHRGVPYTVPGEVERGYVLEAGYNTATLLDAPTGRVVTVPHKDCIEVEQSGHDVSGALRRLGNANG
jgi:hypothetical protein